MTGDQGSAAKGLSYTSGISEIPLRYMTIGDAFDTTVRRNPDSDALVVVHQDIRWSWRQLAERVDALAAGLLALGLEKGDRVAMWSPNCAEWVVIQIATAKAGLILVTLNPAYRVGELEHALNLSGCRAIILADRFKSSDYVAMLLELAPELENGPAGTRCDRLPRLDIAIGLGRVTAGMIPLDAVMERATPASRAALAAMAAGLSPDDPINIQFTSGTTGLPKGATLTHFGLLNNGVMCAQVMGLRPGDRVCVPVPLFHCFGMVLGTLSTVGLGLTMVMPGDAFDAGDVLRAVERERCTVLYGVPTMFIAELAHPDFATFDLRSLRTGAMGGAPCPADVMQRVMTDMGMKDVTIVYGMTETSPVSFQTRVDSDLETRVATVGTVHPWLEARVADVHDRLLPLGEVGELHIRGYSVMAGYWEDARRTEEAIDPAGWMRTGDLAVMDEQGRCRIVGRSKDMIIRGGENVYPVELENFLRTHPAIIDVAVFGVPDAVMGEEICAWVKCAAPVTAEDIKGFCAGRIAHYKVPRYIRFVDEFPMTASGKMHKPTMRTAEARDHAARV